jgi:hypothetical protein
MGEDCGDWENDPTANGQGSCDPDKTEFTGNFIVWRDRMKESQQGTYAASELFRGAICQGTQSVHCKGTSGMWWNS